MVPHRTAERDHAVNLEAPEIMTRFHMWALMKKRGINRAFSPSLTLSPSEIQRYISNSSRNSSHSSSLKTKILTQHTCPNLQRTIIPPSIQTTIAMNVTVAVPINRRKFIIMHYGQICLITQQTFTNQTTTKLVIAATCGTISLKVQIKPCSRPITTTRAIITFGRAWSHIQIHSNLPE